MAEQDFLNRIDRADDWRPIALALSDWLEERGDNRCYAWRWIVAEGYQPAAGLYGSHYWLAWGASSQLRPDYHERVGGWVSEKLLPATGRLRLIHRYDSRHESLVAIVDALMKTTTMQMIGSPG